MKIIVGVFFCLSVFAFGGSPDTGGIDSPDPCAPPVGVCFAPDTPMELVELVQQEVWGDQRYQFDDDDRWSTTSTNGPGLQQGDPTVLTWSVVPDGTSIWGYQALSLGEQTAPSNLRAFLNGIYGNEATWLALFQEIFDRWSEITGVTYVYEPNDDGQPFPSGFPSWPGVSGVRGDVRIAGHRIDGNFGVLAYNFFPNSGDMVIDTDDTFYTNTSNNSLGFKNVLSHEHGHGLGFSHVCPVNQTKLMEPFVTTAFNGPQHDEIRAGQRGYGDAYESNNSAGSAVEIDGGGGLMLNLAKPASLDSLNDQDFYRFTSGTDGLMDVVLTPLGDTYLNGPQNNNGTCSAGTPFNSLNQINLDLQLLDSTGANVLWEASSNNAGLTEMIQNFSVESGETYLVRVFQSGFGDGVQLYELELTFEPPVINFTEAVQSWGASPLCGSGNATVIDLIQYLNGDCF